MTKKRLTDLTSADLLDKPVWRHWYESDVEFVAPTDKTEVTEDNNEGHIVLTDFNLNNKTKYLGFCSPQDSSGLDYIQPVIFTDKGQVELYKDSGWTDLEKTKALDKLGFVSQDVFPIDYVTRIKHDGQIYRGTLLDFNQE